MDMVEICPLVKFEIFGSNRCVPVRRRVGEQMTSACVVPTVMHGGGGVMVWGHFSGGLRLVGLSFVFQQDNDSTHLQAV